MIRFEDQVQRATPRSINVYQSIAALRFARPASSSSVFPTTTSSIRGTTTKVAPRAPSAKSVRRYNPRIGGTAREEDFVLDVRSRAESDGELGALAGAQNIPLDELRARLAEVRTDKPVVVICQTGKRSPR